MDNKSLSHTRWKCQYHIVFIPKYRKKVLFGRLKADVKEILTTLCRHKNVEILAGAVCIDYVHMSVAIPPKLSISDFMGYLKGKSTLMIYDRHPELQSKWDKSFWARGYYVETIGNITDIDWKNYISVMSNRLTGIKSQRKDFSQVLESLSWERLLFQLSEEVQGFIREAKESESLSEQEFEKKYGEEFEMCKALGTNGWVVSGYSNPRCIKNWCKALIARQSDKIIYFFEENDSRVIKRITSTLEQKYDDSVNENYYSRGIKAFQDNDYMTSAMYLVCLLEARVNALVQFPSGTKYKDKFSDKGVFAETKCRLLQNVMYVDCCKQTLVATPPNHCKINRRGKFEPTFTPSVDSAITYKWGLQFSVFYFCNKQDKGFVDIKQEQFAETNTFFTKKYYFLDTYPSLIAFLNRLFVDGKYLFKKGVEPPYINRNWLLHGKCCREIERFECIQLLNALETIENVLGNKIGDIR